MFKISQLVFAYAIQTFHRELNAYRLFKNLKQDKITRILIDKPINDITNILLLQNKIIN